MKKQIFFLLLVSIVILSGCNMFSFKENPSFKTQIDVSDISIGEEKPKLNAVTSVISSDLTGKYVVEDEYGNLF